MIYVEPEYKLSSFTCPHCGTVAMMSWEATRQLVEITRLNVSVGHVFAAFCKACGKPNVWVDGKMVYPNVRGVEPHPDMPSKAKEIFLEAQAVIGQSPRASCALLRLCLEALVDDLGGKGNNLYERIESLNLPVEMKEIFTACRIVGNQASHPGEIEFDSQEGKDLANTLSEFINLIVMVFISVRLKAKAVLNR